MNEVEIADPGVDDEDVEDQAESNGGIQKPVLAAGLLARSRQACRSQTRNITAPGITTARESPRTDAGRNRCPRES